MPTVFQASRLAKHADYGLVYGASRKRYSSSLSFFYRQRVDAAPVTARIGITVPRALGSAPVRNRIKRRVRVASRAALDLLNPYVDVILHPRPVVATMPYAELAQELNSIFRKVSELVATGAPNTPQPRKPRRGKSATAVAQPQRPPA